MRVMERITSRFVAGVGLAAGALLLLSGSVAAQQDGTLDTSFSTDGKTTVAFDMPGSGLEDVAHDVVIQDDGKIVIVGEADWVPGDNTYCAMARLNTDGTPDTTFDSDGKVIYNYSSNQQWFTAVALQGDKILAAGWHKFTDLQSQVNYDFHVVRFNSDGSVDTTFGDAGSMGVGFDDLSPGKWDFLEDMAVQPDGKIVLVGRARATAGDFDIAVARLLADGSGLDATFNGDGRRVLWWDAGGFDDDKGEAVTIQPDGKIVIVATVDVGDFDIDIGVRRLNTDGSTDCSFGGSCSNVLISFNYGAPSFNLDRGRDVVMQGQKILVLGTVDSASGDTDMGFARLNANGTLDPTFGISGSGKRNLPFNSGGDNDDQALGLTLQGNGNIVAVGWAGNSAAEADMAVARLALDGSVDTSFAGFGTTLIPFNLGGDLIDTATSVAIQKNGRIVAVGRAGAGSGSDMDMAIARMNGTPVLFADGFETGDTEIWTTAVP